MVEGCCGVCGVVVVVYHTNKASEQHESGLLLCLVCFIVRCDAIIGESVTALESR